MIKNLVKKIGKVSVILFVLFPYLEILLFWLISKLSLSFWICLSISVILFFVYFILYGLSIGHLLFNCDVKKLLFNNMCIKIGYVPLQGALLLLAGGMGNPFLFLFMGIPLIFSFAFLVMTGILSSVCFLRCRLIEKDKFSSVKWKIVLSYIYVFDVIISIKEYVCLDKNK